MFLRGFFRGELDRRQRELNIVALYVKRSVDVLREVIGKPAQLYFAVCGGRLSVPDWQRVLPAHIVWFDSRENTGTEEPS